MTISHHITSKKLLPKWVQAMGRAAKVALAGPFSKKGRLEIAALADYLGYNPDRPRPWLPQAEPSEICDAESEVSILKAVGDDTNVTARELAILCLVVRQIRPRRIFEFGTYDGRTTLNLAHHAPPDARIVTLDCSLDTHVGRCFRGHPYTARIEQRIGDSMAFEAGADAASIDFVFIDANHMAPYVRRDTESALALLRREGGTIVWHDYAEWPGVTSVVDAYAQREPRLRNTVWVSGTHLAVCRVAAA